MEVKLGFSDGRYVMGQPPEILHAVDKTKEISLVFDTTEIYTGYLSEVDDERIHLTKPGKSYGVSLPMNRLLAWYYKEDII